MSLKPALHSAHSERIPARDLFELEVFLQEHHEHLVGACGIARTPRRGDDGVSRLAVGDHGRLPLKYDARIALFDRSFTVAHVAAAIALGRRRREQHLLVADAAHEHLMPGTAAAVPDDQATLV
jgi:hypothetical protein